MVIKSHLISLEIILGKAIFEHISSDEAKSLMKNLANLVRAHVK